MCSLEFLPYFLQKQTTKTLKSFQFLTASQLYKQKRHDKGPAGPDQFQCHDVGNTVLEYLPADLGGEVMTRRSHGLKMFEAHGGRSMRTQDFQVSSDQNVPSYVVYRPTGTTE